MQAQVRCRLQMLWLEVSHPFRGVHSRCLSHDERHRRLQKRGLLLQGRCKDGKKKCMCFEDTFPTLSRCSKLFDIYSLLRHARMPSLLSVSMVTTQPRFSDAAAQDPSPLFLSSARPSVSPTWLEYLSNANPTHAIAALNLLEKRLVPLASFSQSCYGFNCIENS